MTTALKDAQALDRLAREAGALVLRIRKEHQEAVRDWAHAEKPDGSPVTKADRESEAHIIAGIEKLGLQAPIVAEETSSMLDVANANGFYLIDPVDGTKAFIGGGADFSVNIGFVENGVPVLGVLHAPVSNESWYCAEGAAFYVGADGIEQ